MNELNRKQYERIGKIHMNEKNKMFDVPVYIKIWSRPECQRKQFDIIRRVKPTTMFILSDGGRNENEWKLIQQNRNMIDNGIDWECKVYRQYWDKNVGLYASGKAMCELIWKNVDRCIMLEDDILPSVSFFYFCAELLEKYKDDERISAICGMNHLGKYDKPSSDYFFSRQGSIWGTAIWRRTAVKYGNLDYRYDEYVLNNLVHLTKHNKDLKRRIVGYSKNDLFDGHMPGDEFGNEFSSYGFNQLMIVPKVNLVSNIGCTSDSAHADSYEMISRLERKHFNMPLYEIIFPLKHPQYIFPDEFYDKERNKIMLYNHPFLHLISRIDRFFVLVKNKRFKYILSKITNLNQKEIEN